MKQCGVVVSTKGDKAKVSLQRHSACGDCKGCRWGDDDMKMEIEVVNSINAKAGDRVEVNMENQNVLAAAFIAYMIPLITLIGGVVLGSFILDKIGLVQYKEIGSGIIGLVLTAISYIIIKSKESSFKTNKSFAAVITTASEE